MDSMEESCTSILDGYARMNKTLDRMIEMVGILSSALGLNSETAENPSLGTVCLQEPSLELQRRSDKWEFRPQKSWEAITDDFFKAQIQGNAVATQVFDEMPAQATVPEILDEIDEISLSSNSCDEDGGIGLEPTVSFTLAATEVHFAPTKSLEDSQTEERTPEKVIEEQHHVLSVRQNPVTMPCLCITWLAMTTRPRVGVAMSVVPERTLVSLEDSRWVSLPRDKGGGCAFKLFDEMTRWCSVNESQNAVVEEPPYVVFAAEMEVSDELPKAAVAFLFAEVPSKSQPIARPWDPGGVNYMILDESTEQYFVSSFLSGLTDELKPMVKVLKPRTVLDAFETARYQERSLAMIWRGSKVIPKPISSAGPSVRGKPLQVGFSNHGKSPHLSQTGRKKDDSWRMCVRSEFTYFVVYFLLVFHIIEGNGQ